MDLCVWHEDKVCKGEGDGKDGWYLYRGQCMLKIDLWSELFYGLPFTLKFPFWDIIIINTIHCKYIDKWCKEITMIS